MKWSSKIIIAIILILVLASFTSNLIVKREYDKIDKNDRYWTYGTVLSEYFKFIKINGGNITKIFFEQSPNCSIRVTKDWQRRRENLFVASVKDDTLFVNFTYTPNSLGEKKWMEDETLVRVFAPKLDYLEEHNTNFGMFKTKQKSINLKLSGKSFFEMESFDPELDSIKVNQNDSSQVVFEMSPEYSPGSLKSQASDKELTSPESFKISHLEANLSGNSILDVGHGRIKSMQLNIADSSAIIISGRDLRSYCGQKY